MGDQSQAQAQDPVASLTGQLADAAGRIDTDDLSGLAKMHGWCESLAGVTGPDGEHPDAAIREQVCALGALVEGLVVGEAEDPGAAFSEMRRMAAALATGSAAAEPEAAPAPSAPGESADHLTAKMDAIFDEESPAAPPPADDDPGGTENTQAEPAAGDSRDQGPPQTSASEVPPYEQEPLVIKENEVEFVKGFVEEANEHLESVESAVLEVERSADDSEKINDLFRPFHTIKGMAGFLNLRDVNCLTHEVETLLDQGRRGQRKITPGLIDVIFDVVDILRAQIGAINAYLGDPDASSVAQPPVAEMIGYLRSVVAGRAEPSAKRPGPGSGAQRVGENLVEQGAVPQEVVDFALEAQRSGKTDKKTGEILRDNKAVTAKQVSQAVRPQTQAAAKVSSGGDQSVRIDTRKLDTLVDMVGELVIAQTLVSTHPLVAEDPILTKNVAQVGKIVRDVQEVAMGMRMVPIGPTFQRMARLVRDVSHKAGKKVELRISGEETELDKNVIQQIGDPLVHMVRNAVDHGVETPRERLAAGKSETGIVHLSAYHHGGNIVIEISDDGKGLDREALMAKAVEKGILTGGEEKSDSEVFALIFAPGFSTAKEVTDISGRGVGMDVVKRNIEALRGRVEIASEIGKGSTFMIRLPLTLAIIDGMVVRAGAERFIIQTVTIEQSLRPRPEHITTVQHKGEILQLRGELLPLIQLGEVFGLAGRVAPCENMVIIAHCDGRKIGIVVEELIGQQQVVIKTLGERFADLQGISGAAILGDGRVGLILETSGLEAAYQSFRSAEEYRPPRPRLDDSERPSTCDASEATEGVDLIETIPQAVLS